MTRTTVVTCAPPNPNGDLHLGHLSGPFLGADVLRRYLAARGRPVVYVSYTDDESCYVPRRAAEIRRTPRQTAFVYTRRIEETLSLAGMLPDYYGHPHRDPVHQQLVHQHVRRLHAAGALQERELPVPYCERCRTYLFEADLRGRCRRCGAASDGTYCEDCGHPHDPEGLAEPVCVRCRTVPATRQVRRLVLPLERWAAPLADYYADRPWRPALREYCLRQLKEGLPDTPVSRQSSYGVPVPLPGWDGHIVDTWTSGIFGYMAATAGYGAALGSPELWQELWSDPDTEIVQFIGFDCSFSHAVLWPTLLLAHGERTLPQHIITNQFSTLDGAKFSTSRGHAIWGSQFLREQPADAVRLHLCLTSPETEESDFSLAGYQDTVHTLLAGRFERWAAGLFDLIAEQAGGQVPALPAEDHAEPAVRLRRWLVAEVGRALEPGTFSLRRAAGAVSEAATQAEEQLRAQRSGPAVPTGGAGRPGGGALDPVLAGHAALLASCAAAAAPMMPTWSRRVWTQLGLPQPAAPEADLRWPAEALAGAVGGRTVRSGYEPLFARPR